MGKVARVAGGVDRVGCDVPGSEMESLRGLEVWVGAGATTLLFPRVHLSAGARAPDVLAFSKKAWLGRKVPLP